MIMQIISLGYDQFRIVGNVRWCFSDVGQGIKPAESFGLAPSYRAIPSSILLEDFNTARVASDVSFNININILISYPAVLLSTCFFGIYEFLS